MRSCCAKKHWMPGFERSRTAAKGALERNSPLDLISRGPIGSCAGDAIDLDIARELGIIRPQIALLAVDSISQSWPDGQVGARLCRDIVLNDEGNDSELEQVAPEEIQRGPAGPFRRRIKADIYCLIALFASCIGSRSRYASMRVHKWMPRVISRVTLTATLRRSCRRRRGYNRL